LTHNRFQKYRKRKAVSPVIATLLLIAIAVAAAIIVYSFVTGLIGGLSTGGSSNQVALTASFNSVGGGVVILTLKNTGSVATSALLATQVSFKVNGATCGAGIAGCPPAAGVTWSPNTAISPGQSATTSFVPVVDTVAGTTYTISFQVSYASGSTIYATATATSN